MRVGVGLCLLHLCLALLRGFAESEGKEYNRYDFPKDFVFGASTSAYQVEGAALEDGRKPSIYDTFAHRLEYDTRNPDVACDQYHKYKEDVQLMVETGLDAYRFSISWSRLIPNGRGAVNPKGLRFYNNLINELINHGIEPHVTLLHTDLPQVLEDEYGGFLNPRIIEDFTSYVDVCFREFGDRVRHWTTFNEANIFVFGGYDVGNTPPSRCSSPFGFFNCTKGNSTTEPYIAAHHILLAHAYAVKLYKEKYKFNIFVFGGYDVGNTPPSRCSSPFGFFNCTKGNSTTEPYIAAHHILLAHAYAVKLYKEKYKGKQDGLIGFNLLSYHFAPFTDTREDMLAGQRSYDFLMGWFMHPLTYGDYPEIMKKNAGTRIPIFTKNESKLLKGSIDFIGINYYTAIVVKDNSMSLNTTPRDFIADMATKWIFFNTSALSEKIIFPNEPLGLERVLEYYKDVYENPLIFIHENGQAASYNTSTNDSFRVEYLRDHVEKLHNAVRNGSNTKGYFVWSLLDVYELLFGFDYTFGIYYVDYNDPNLTRHPKLSQQWYSQFLKGRNTTANIQMNQAQDTTISTRSSI